MSLGGTNLYFLTFILVTAATLLCLLLCRLALSSDSKLKLNYILVGLCILLPLVAPFFNQSFELQPVAHIEAASSLREFDLGLGKELVSVGPTKSSLQIGADRSFQILMALVAISLLLGIGKLAVDIKRLREILRGAYVIRRIGRVRVAVSGRIRVPFSAWFFGAWVLLPTDLISDSSAVRISILHELQHHRQKDTLWIYAIQILKALLFLNPLMWIWEKQISEIQECACDENIINRGKASRGEYAHQLIAIAENAVQRKEQLVCAAGLAFLNDRHSLSRRMESMFQEKSYQRKLSWALGLALVISLTGTAMAAKQIVGDRRISLIEAQKMADQAKQGTEFPIVMNDQVLKQLNRYLGTEEGRRFVRESIERMESYRSILDTKLEQYQMPTELLAIGIVESGYKNLPQASNKSWGAGVWMFIESTAKVFGLQVNAGRDDRLNVEMETDAAMRYLSANNLRFKNWLLAIQAYNSGERAVENAIEEHGTRDVWVLLKAGLSSDKDYLARVMAMVLILKTPATLN